MYKYVQGPLITQRELIASLPELSLKTKTSSRETRGSFGKFIAADAPGFGCR